MDNKIKCPNCGHEFDASEVIVHQAKERLKQEFALKSAEQVAFLNNQKEALEKEKRELALTKERENEIFKERLDKRVVEERVKLQKALAEESQLKIKLLEEENEKRKAENLELKSKELNLLRKEQELKEKQEAMAMQMEKQLLMQRGEITEEVRKKEQERNELKFKEYEKQLEDQRKLVEEMQRKAEQGSMQLQGEVQELALEDVLRNAFRHDLIEEVGKGMRGADIVQTVINPLMQDCGKIIFESKRTKVFSDGWIEKLKEDQRDAGAVLAVIVTEALPKEMNGFGRKDGVWICTYHEMQHVVYVLREMLIREYSVRLSEENKGDKMHLLYNYLVSDDFRQRVEAIVEGFSSLKTEMDREKRALQKIWKEREKQIEKVIGNTIDMYGSIRGIAGNVIGQVKALELDLGDREDADDE